MKSGRPGALTFSKVGLLLVLAVLLAGLVWGSMKWYVHQVEAEYEAARAPFSPNLVLSEGQSTWRKRISTAFMRPVNDIGPSREGGRKLLLDIF